MVTIEVQVEPEVKSAVDYMAEQIAYLGASASDLMRWLAEQVVADPLPIARRLSCAT